MPVLERAREQRLDPELAGTTFEDVALWTESDHHHAGVEPLHRLQQDVDALLGDELAEVHDGRLLAREERGEPTGVAVVGEPLLDVARVRLVVPGLSEQRLECDVARLGQPQLDVDARRHLVDPCDLAAHLLENGADVLRADERRGGACERGRTPLRERSVSRASRTRARSRAP